MHDIRMALRETKSLPEAVEVILGRLDHADRTSAFELDALLAALHSAYETHLARTDEPQP